MLRLILLVTLAMPVVMAHNIRKMNCFRSKAALEACEWVSAADSPYNGCMSMMTKKTVARMMYKCKRMYCNHGQPGVCKFGEALDDTCEDKYEICPDGPPPGCTPKKHSNCPMGDTSDAENACAWVYPGSGSPFEDCFAVMPKMHLDYIYQRCIDIYCKSGMKGVCYMAHKKVQMCEGLLLTTIEGTLDECKPPVPPTTPSPQGDYCGGPPSQSNEAKEACEWVRDDDGPFEECYEEFDLNKQELIYRTCLEIYCTKGNAGVCEFAENFADLCDDNYELKIVYELDFCPKPPTPPPGPYCREAPESDPVANKVCEEVFGADSPYADCLENSDKKIFRICLRTYCRKGLKGVCELAMTVANMCEEDYGICIDRAPEVCDSDHDHDHSHSNKGYCHGNGEDDHNAIDACKFLYDHKSSFYHCVSGMDCGHAHLLYKTCVHVYCERGTHGVCMFADYVSSICWEKYNEVTNTLPICVVESEIHPFCPEDPALDQPAIDACSWALDQESPFYDCLDQQDIYDRMKVWVLCIYRYCDLTQDGVCQIADRLTDTCHFPANPLDVCAPPVITTTTTEAPVIDCGETDPGQVPEAIHACAWMLEQQDNPQMAACSDITELHTKKDFFRKCVVKFCSHGQDGVCDVIEEIATYCGDNGIPIDNPTDFCLPPTQPPTIPPDFRYCYGPAAEDANAQRACEWVTDPESPFADCVGEDSEAVHATCLAMFCRSGLRAVCEYARSLANKCDHNGMCIEDGPSICGYHKEHPRKRRCDKHHREAKAACSFILNSQADSYKCSKQFPVGKLKSLYQLCIKGFCTYGHKGICNAASHVADVCYSSYNMSVYFPDCSDE